MSDVLLSPQAWMKSKFFRGGVSAMRVILTAGFMALLLGLVPRLEAQ